MWRKATERQITCDMVWTFECSRLRRLTTIFWGTVSQWTTNDRSSTWNFTRISVRTRTVRRYEHSWRYLTRHFEVPVIVVFTKHDQFIRNVAIHLSDYPNEYPKSNVSEVAETLFQEHYMQHLGNDIKFVRLKSGFGHKCQCVYADVLWQKCTCQTVAAMILLRRQLQH